MKYFSVARLSSYWYILVVGLLHSSYTACAWWGGLSGSLAQHDSNLHSCSSSSHRPANLRAWQGLSGCIMGSRSLPMESRLTVTTQVTTAGVPWWNLLLSCRTILLRVIRFLPIFFKNFLQLRCFSVFYTKNVKLPPIKFSHRCPHGKQSELGITVLMKENTVSKKHRFRCVLNFVIVYLFN